MSGVFLHQFDTWQLPSDFKNEIILTRENFCIIRSNVSVLADCNKWVTAFGNSTSTQWIVRKSLPQGQRIVCKKDYVCHHSSFQKVDPDKNRKGHSKNTLCPASISIKVKVNSSRTRSTDKYMKKGLPAIIRISTEHSHSLSSSQTLHFLQANQSLRDIFFEYFHDRMTVAQARKIHEHVLERLGSQEDLSNGSKNPTARTISYWHDTWKKEFKEPRDSLKTIKKLEEKLPEYEKDGFTILFAENPLCVVILSPIMKRAHDLPMASEILYMDTTSCCDSLQNSMIFLSTPCAAGAAPLGILITHDQSTLCYENALRLLSDGFPNAFRKQRFPKTVLSNMSLPETEAVENVWPESNHLLCVSRILQAVWCFLWDPKNKIVKDDRFRLMDQFQKILYAKNVTEMEEVYKTCLEANQSVPQFISFLQAKWNTNEKWCLAFRSPEIRCLFPNNFFDASVQVFKSTILFGVKGYNVIAVINFVSNFVESAYKFRFQTFANFEGHKCIDFFKKCLEEPSCVDRNDITKLDESVFLFSLLGKRNEVVALNVDIGACTCEHGRIGKFCKHQCMIYQNFDVYCENFSEISTNDQHEIKILANGIEKCTQRSYSDDSELILDGACPKKCEYVIVTVDDFKQEQQLEIESNFGNVIVDDDDVFNNVQELKTDVIDSTADDSKINVLLRRILKCFSNKVEYFQRSFSESEYVSLLEEFEKRLDLIKTSGQFEQFLCPLQVPMMFTAKIPIPRLPGNSKGTKRPEPVDNSNSNSHKNKIYKK